ncbi:MAG: ABC transporter permease [Actinobacteria bacterium]|jgi:ABC-2 type transport system permease protein|nr:ABC transporter permease [Actinomycetota bacterium]
MRTRQVLLVAQREIRQRLRSKAFVGTTALLAVVVLGAAVVFTSGVGPFGDQGDAGADDEVTAPVEVAVVGELSEPARAAITASAGAEPVWLEVDDLGAARQAITDGAAFAVADGGRRLLARQPSGPFESPVPFGTVEALGIAVSMEAAGADAAEVDAALRPVAIQIETVQTGEGVDAETAAGRFAVAYGGSFALYMALAFFTQIVATGVIEEKGSRVVELMLPAVPPRQLLGGKLLGLGLIGTAQMVVIVVPALVYVLVRQPDLLPPGTGASLASVVVFFALGFALYAGVTGGLAALASRVEDLQSVIMPLWAILIVAFMLSFPTLGAPDSTLAVIATFVPFSAPFVVPVRLALVELPLWQAALSGLIVLVSAGLLTMLAARLYEGSILRGGGKVGYRAAWRGARG